MTYSEEQYQDILAVCRSYKNDYDRAFERLKAQQREIDALKEENKSCKATAKEILSDLYFLHDSVQGINQKTDFYYSIEQLIAEIEIKYGVEVEE